MKRHHRIAAVTAALALGVPAAAAWWVHARTQTLAAHLGAKSGVSARIGGVDADLTGTIRLSNVELGRLFSAEAIEASVALASLIDGRLTADEIRVEAPHVAIAIDRDGDSDLARLVRRFGTRHGSGAQPTHVRRIVVSSGTLVARIAGVGELSADRVELVPDGAGARLITGRLRVRAGTSLVRADLELARAAAELSLPTMTFGRVLAVAGTGTLAIGDRAVLLRDVAIGRLAPHGSLEARALVDDAGAPRAIAAELRPDFALAVGGERLPLALLAPLAPRGVVLDGAHASGHVTIARNATQVQLWTDVALTGVRIEHPTLAAEPVTLDATLATTVALSPTAIVVERATLATGAARWTASGWLRRQTPISGALDLQLTSAPCMDLFDALPIALRGPLDGIAMTGTFGGSAHLSIDLAAPPGEGVDLTTDIDNRCDVAAEPPAADVTTLDTKRPPEWTELRKLPDYVPAAFVSAEDGRFYDHHGFDLYQIARSFEIDLRDRRLARGGSTISQQLVKNELLTQRRSLDRKIQEAILTWRLEARLKKRAILERYLNVIELGPRVHGIAAASAYWFDVSPHDLSLKQAAFLAALTSEPQSMSRRVRDEGALDKESAERVDIVLRAMRRDGAIGKDELEEARESTLRFAGTALRHEL